MKKYYQVMAKRGQELKEFIIYTSKNHRDNVAHQVAKNIFYCENVVILNIK